MRTQVEDFMSHNTIAMPIELSDAELDEVSGGSKIIVYGNIGVGGNGYGGIIIKPKKQRRYPD
jgi:hypothetical protein